MIKPTDDMPVQPVPSTDATTNQVPSPAPSQVSETFIEKPKKTVRVIKKITKPSVPPVSSATPEITPASQVGTNNEPNFTQPKSVSQVPLASKIKVIPISPLKNKPPVSNSWAEKKLSQEGPASEITGILDTSKDGHGVLRMGFTAFGEKDAYISTSQIRRFKLRPGDMITGPAREPKESERYWGLLKVDKINGKTAEEFLKQDRPKFQTLTPVYPDEQIILETGDEPLSLRIIDLIAPIGKGQRSLIVSPPKAGKTTLLKDIASGIASNHPEIHVMAVLVGERPEEVTDIKRHIERITKGKGEVAASNFDESAEDQCRVSELALERAKRLVEEGKDVVILLDSITRLARAYNLSIPTSGRTLSGGFDPAALFPPKKFFGAARNFEIPGSLTIVGTALVDTGSRMDDLIYEEFKGTGNQEVHLDRRLAERRIHPAIDVQRSGTRRDDILMDPVKYQSVTTLHRMLDMLDNNERTTTLIDQLRRSKSNKEFLVSLKTG